MPRFKYIPLASQEGQIRLITISRGNSSDEIRCQTTFASLDDNPLYQAISYEWGDPEPLIEIFVDGKVFEVRHNLFLLLQQLTVLHASNQNKSEELPVWIDAICVDQRNEVEKSAQVQQMGRVFRQAQLVLAWLGWPSDWDPLSAVSAIKRVDSASAEAAITMKMAPNFAPYDLLTQRPKLLPYILQLCSCRYWSRRWIVQELISASQIRILCGAQILSWTNLAATFKLINHISQQDWNQYGATASEARQLTQKIISTIPYRIWNQRNKQQLSGGLVASLPDLLVEYEQTACELVHDRVFSLAGLAIGPSLRIDYTLSTAELFGAVLSAKRSLDPNRTLDPTDLERVTRTMELPWMIENLTHGEKKYQDFAEPMQYDLKVESQFITYVLQVRACDYYAGNWTSPQSGEFSEDFYFDTCSLRAKACFPHHMCGEDWAPSSLSDIRHDELRCFLEQLHDWIRISRVGNRPFSASGKTASPSLGPGSQVMVLCADGTLGLACRDVLPGDCVCRVSPYECLLVLPDCNDPVHRSRITTSSSAERETTPTNPDPAFSNVRVIGVMEPLKRVNVNQAANTTTATNTTITCSMEEDHWKFRHQTGSVDKEKASTVSSVEAELSSYWNSWTESDLYQDYLNTFANPISLELTFNARGLIGLMDEFANRKRPSPWYGMREKG